MSVEKSRFGFDEQAGEAPPQTGESVSPKLARGFGAPNPESLEPQGLDKNLPDRT